MVEKPRAVVVECRYAGHALGFAQDVAIQLATAGYETTLALNGQTRDQPQKLELRSGPFGIHWIDGFTPTYFDVAQGERELEVIEQLVTRLQPDRVVVPTADALALAVGDSDLAVEHLSRLPPLDLVLHWLPAGRWPTGVRTWQRFRRSIRELRRLRKHRLFTCDPYVGLGPGRTPIRACGCSPPSYLPHPLSKQAEVDRPEARRSLGMPEGVPYLVSTGDVAPRKGCDVLLQAMARDDWPDDVRVLLAGPVGDRIRPEIERVRTHQPDRVQVIDRFLDREEFAAAFIAADVIWAVKLAPGVSSTCMYAARLGRPAIVSAADRSSVWTREKIGPGVSTRLTPPAVSRAVRNALECGPQIPTQSEFLDDLLDAGVFQRSFQIG